MLASIAAYQKYHGVVCMIHAIHTFIHIFIRTYPSSLTLFTNFMHSYTTCHAIKYTPYAYTVWHILSESNLKCFLIQHFLWYITKRLRLISRFNLHVYRHHVKGVVIPLSTIKKMWKRKKNRRKTTRKKNQ